MLESNSGCLRKIELGIKHIGYRLQYTKCGHFFFVFRPKYLKSLKTLHLSLSGNSQKEKALKTLIFLCVFKFVTDNILLEQTLGCKLMEKIK